MGSKIAKATFDVDSKNSTIEYSQIREMTAPSSLEDEARVNSKINERFKSMSIRGIKNHSTTAAAAGTRTNIVARRRNLGGIRQLRELDTSTIRQPGPYNKSIMSPLGESDYTINESSTPSR